jgi:hypothetical protein
MVVAVNDKRDSEVADSMGSLRRRFGYFGQNCEKKEGRVHNPKFGCCAVLSRVEAKCLIPSERKKIVAIYIKGAPNHKGGELSDLLHYEEKDCTSRRGVFSLLLGGTGKLLTAIEVAAQLAFRGAQAACWEDRWITKFMKFK